MSDVVGGEVNKGAPSSAFRRDIEGLRAVAIVAVVLFHAGLWSFEGGYVGVDVFYVLSGFLITTLLLKELAATNRVRLIGFYARRIRRLLPASVFVFVVTLLLARSFMAPLAYLSTTNDAPFAAAYVSNIRFGLRALDYLASERPSAHLHYWSLAVEEQFYVVWPALVLVAVRIAGRRALPWVVGAITAGSFVACVLMTSSRQPYAFFLLPFRAWELGAGAAIALLAPALRRIPGRARGPLSVLGIVAIGLAVFTFDDLTAFPGVAATLPVLGTAAVIVAGPTALVNRAISVAPMQLLGRWSYAIYLWHWPLFVMARGDGRVPPSTTLRVALILVTVVLAAVTFRLIETPLRTSRRLVSSATKSIALGVALTTVALVAAVSVRGTPPLDAGIPAAAADGELTFVPDDVRPSLLGADTDVPAIYGEHCHVEYLGTEPLGCTYGDEEAARTIVLLGDSHAAQWFPALEAIAADDGWRLVVMTKSACPAADVTVRSRALDRRYRECERFREAAIDAAKDQVDPVLVMSSFMDYDLLGDGDDLQQWEDGVTATADAFGGRVVVIGDTPQPGYDVPECLSAHLRAIQRCEPTRDESVDRLEVAAVERGARRADARFVDTSDWICPAERSTCPVIVGNVLVFRDTNHVTATRAEAFAERLARFLPA